MIAPLALFEFIDSLTKAESNILKEICEIGLKPCAECKGSGKIKWGLVTDVHRKIVDCPTCQRKQLHEALEMIKELEEGE